MALPKPFIKFYLRDWEGDVQLMDCSLAARGLLIHIMRVMQEAEPYGFFVGRNGEPIDMNQFAKRVRAQPREIRKLMLELEDTGTISRDAFGRLYSRRMVREAAKLAADAENGKTGGNPSLKRPDNHMGDNPIGVNARDKTHGNTRNQKPEYTDSLRSSAEGFGSFPGDVEGLRKLAALFVGAFANCRDESKAEKHLGHYAQVLAQMRSRGVSIAEAWQACSDALENFGRPLFGASIKSAMAFLPPSGSVRRPNLRVVTTPQNYDPVLQELRAAEKEAG